MKLPNFNRLNQIKRNIFPFIVSHRILILVLIIVSISTVSFGAWAIKVRNNFIIGMKSAKNVSSNEADYSVTPAPSSLNSDNLSSSDSSVLGLSDNSFTNVGDNGTFPIPTSYPTITEAPLPTFFPESTTYTPSTSSCAGKPNAGNSQVYVSSSSIIVNNAVTISVELRDCNNDFAPVNDDLKIALLNDDSSARINGSSPPVTIKAQNGKASFSVNSQIATTDTFVITDTTNSFNVTTPGYHNPSVTFTNNSSGNSDCTTGSGVANSWFSDVYPVSPVSGVIGSTVTFTVIIRDCNKNTAPVTDTLSISLNSGDSTTQVNGNNPPYSLTTQKGQASFTVTSQTAGTDTFIIQDITNSFKVTDTNNNNPSVTFSGLSTSTATPTPTVVVSQSPTPGPTSEDITVTLSPTVTSSPTSAPTSTASPVPTSTPISSSLTPT